MWPWKKTKRGAGSDGRTDAGKAGEAQDAGARDAGARDNDDDDANYTDPVDDSPLTDELDLHHFLPRECADVVEEYVRAAQEAGFTRVRIIHGKGKGTLRRVVESVLSKHPAVKTFQLAGSTGGWGATAVELHPTPTPPAIDKPDRD